MKRISYLVVLGLVFGGVAHADYIRDLRSKIVRSDRVVVGDGPAASGGIGDLDVQGNLIVTGTTALTGDLTGNVTGDLTGDVTGNVTGQVFGTTADEQIIAAAGTIAADSCGGIKRISTNDLGAVTTDTTNTFTAPAAGNKGCVMQVCNSGGTDAITLDDNALFEGSGIAGATPGDTVLGVADCVAVGSDGAVWRQLGPGSQN